MYIKNKNGEFSVYSSQYNYLVRNFDWDEIDAKLVLKTNFINSSSEYSKAASTTPTSPLSISPLQTPTPETQPAHIF